MKIEVSTTPEQFSEYVTQNLNQQSLTETVVGIDEKRANDAVAKNMFENELFGNLVISEDQANKRLWYSSLLSRARH